MRRIRITGILFGLLLLAGCDLHADTRTLADAKRGFKTVTVQRSSEREPVEVPPPEVFALVHYPAATGKLPAYVSPDPQDGRKHPAILWIHGGDCNSIGDMWHPAPPENDQTARAFREAGLILMLPSLRGGNDNPGVKEGFFGEVDDVVAAADFLARQDYVDPNRIYLGGHSTGGTLALLVAESTSRFRATFAFGPVTNVANYGEDYLPFDTESETELRLRAPILWLYSIRTPTFVIEGARQPSNIASLRDMAKQPSNPAVTFLAIGGVDHFSVLAPATRVIAQKLLADDGPSTRLAFTADELHGR